MTGKRTNNTSLNSLSKDDKNVYLRADAVEAIIKETEPRCYHCGQPYVKDEKLSGNNYNTWMPMCLCINKSTIRIVTGVGIIIEN